MVLVAANAGRFGLLALAVFTAATLRREARTGERTAALVVEAEDVRSLCRRSGWREPSFFERLRAIGVAGLALRPEPLAGLIASKEVLRFDAAEVDKLKETGVALPEAPLKPGTVFVRDERVSARLRGAARAQGLDLTEGRYGRMRVLEFPAGLELGAVSAGYDPALAAAAGAAGLAAVYRAAASADLRLALEAPLPAAALLDAPLGAFNAEVRQSFASSLAQRRLWGAAPPAQAGDAGLLVAVEMPVGIPSAQFRRAVSDLGSALVVIRLDPLAPPEAALADLRRLSRGLREDGTAPSWPSRLAETRRPGRLERAGRLFLAALAAALGPLWALRQGLASARRMARSRVVPEAAPLREGFVGLCAVAAGVGLSAGVVRALLADGIGASAGNAWKAAAALTAAAAFAGLWMSDAAKWGQLRRRHRGTLLRAAGAAVGAAFLIDPPAALTRWAFGLSAVAAWRPAWWWVPAHGFEIIVGFPALFVGLCLYAESLRLSKEQRCAATDPRPWLFVGIVATAGAVQTLTGPGMPLATLLVHYACGLAPGLCFGVLFWLAAERRKNRAAA